MQRFEVCPSIHDCDIVCFGRVRRVGAQAVEGTRTHLRQKYAINTNKKDKG
jgi:hypothetical protein